MSQITKDDDQKTFLENFKRVAEAAGWEPSMLKMWLNPCLVFLTGESQVMHHALSWEEETEKSKKPFSIA